MYLGLSLGFSSCVDSGDPRLRQAVIPRASAEKATALSLGPSSGSQWVGPLMNSNFLCVSFPSPLFLSLLLPLASLGLLIVKTAAIHWIYVLSQALRIHSSPCAGPTVWSVSSSLLCTLNNCEMGTQVSCTKNGQGRWRRWRKEGCSCQAPSSLTFPLGPCLSSGQSLLRTPPKQFVETQYPQDKSKTS